VPAPTWGTFTSWTGWFADCGPYYGPADPVYAAPIPPSRYGEIDILLGVPLATPSTDDPFDTTGNPWADCYTYDANWDPASPDWQSLTFHDGLWHNPSGSSPPDPLPAGLHVYVQLWTYTGAPFQHDPPTPTEDATSFVPADWLTPPAPPPPPDLSAAGTSTAALVRLRGKARFGLTLSAAGTSTAALRLSTRGTLTAAGSATARLVQSVPLGDNEPAVMALDLSGHLDVEPPDPAQLLPGERHLRAQPSIVLAMATPAIVDGRPIVPRWWARPTSGTSAVQGPSAIHAVQNPDPVYNDGWLYPPPPASTPMHARWVVSDLPDPAAHGGYYWLGDPSAADGTAGIEAGARQWAPHANNPDAPAWHSFFPYKPAVVSVSNWVPAGYTVTHPKGVAFNSRFIEHMFLDWGTNQTQPFSWVIAAMFTTWPDRGYVQYVLDAGRNPDAIGVPRIDDSQTGYPRAIDEGLDYRTLLAYRSYQSILCTRPDTQQNRTIRGSQDAALRPKMLFGIFNGAHSYVGSYDPGARRIKKGTVDNTGAQTHRYYVLGRSQGWLSQAQASHLLVFEIRFWDAALTLDDLDGQYGQLSSAYQFNAYRG